MPENGVEPSRPYDQQIEDSKNVNCREFEEFLCYVCYVARRDLSVFFAAASLMILRNPAKCFRYSDFVTADNVG